MLALKREYLDNELKTLEKEGLLRVLKPGFGSGGVYSHNGQRIINFSSNDYLNLANDIRVKSAVKTAVDQWGCGATASRLMSGNLCLHEQLESEISKLCRQEAALVFGSGFLANLAVISSLAGKDDLIFSDRLNHASLIDGCRLSGAKIYRYNHCDADHLESLLKSRNTKGKRIIVTDSIFSMDGDFAPLEKLYKLSLEYNCWFIVDEAHAIGIFGNEGSGLCHEAGTDIKPDLITGTLSKALGSYGAFVATSSNMRSILINKARSFIYTTALAPSNVAAAKMSIDVIKEEKTLGRDLLNKAELFYEMLKNKCLPLENYNSQIIPVIVGDNERCLKLSNSLAEDNIICTAVRPPTVPKTTSRIRLSVSAAHQKSDLEFAAERISYHFNKIMKN